MHLIVDLFSKNAYQLVIFPIFFYLSYKSLFACYIFNSIATIEQITYFQIQSFVGNRVQGVDKVKVKGLKLKLTIRKK